MNLAIEPVHPEKLALLRGCYMGGWTAYRTANALHLTISTVRHHYREFEAKMLPRYNVALDGPDDEGACS